MGMSWIKPAALGIALGAMLALAACGGKGELPTEAVPGGDAEKGRAAIEGYGCGACHSIPGVRGATATVGPPLDHFSQRVFVAGRLANMPDNVVKWIEHPQQVSPGTAMPELGVNEAAARDIAAYLETLQ